MDDQFAVTAAAGTFLPTVRADVTFPHKWTPAGVAVEAPFTGAHLLHLATAACVLNDLYREAQSAAIELDGVRVTASGGFDTATWRSTGIRYRVEVDSPAGAEAVAALVATVDRVAEIPRALRAGTEVRREPVTDD